MKPERVNEIYEKMKDLVIELDPNPAARGPKYLQNLISKTRGFLNTTTFFLQEVLQERHTKELSLEAAEADFDVQSDELITGDTRVTSLPSVVDRQAMVRMLLRKEQREISKLKREIKNLGLLERSVRFCHKELDSTMSAIRLQRSIIETELKTGSFYGDENGVARSWGKTSSQGIQKMDDIDQMTDEELTNWAGEWDAQLEADSSDSSKESPAATPKEESKKEPSDDALSLLEDLDLEGSEDAGLVSGNDTSKTVPSTSTKEELSGSSVEVGSDEDVSEDPDISKFLDTDEEFSDIFDDL